MEVGDTLNGGTIVDVDWDGEKLFYYVKTTSDKTTTGLGASPTTAFVSISSVNTLTANPIAYQYSQSTAPTNPASGTVWYDTTNNIVYSYGPDGTSDSYQSLPLCTVNRTTGGVITSLNCILSPVTFIATTLFLAKGTKLLFPNGRNADGTCKNIEVTTQKTILRLSEASTSNAQGTGLFAVYNGDGSIGITLQSLQNWGYEDRLTNPTYIKCYVTSENQWYQQTGVDTQIYNKLYLVNIGNVSMTSGKYTFLQNKTFKTFSALDMNNTSYISNQVMPSSTMLDISLAPSGTYYTAPADGYINFSKISTAAGQSVELYTGVNIRAFSTGNNQSIKVFAPVRKGFRFNVTYNLAGETDYFKFIFARGALQ